MKQNSTVEQQQSKESNKQSNTVKHKPCHSYLDSESILSANTSHTRCISHQNERHVNLTLGTKLVNDATGERSYID